MPIGIRQPFRPRYPGDIGDVDPEMQAIADAAAAEDAARFGPAAPMGDVTMSPEAAAILELAKQRIGIRQQQPEPAGQRIGVPILPQEAGGFTPNPYNGPGIQYGPPGTVFRNEGGAGVPPIRTDRPYFAPGTMPPEDEGIDPRSLVTDDMRLRNQQALDAAGISQANRIQNPETFSTGQEMALRDKFQPSDKFLQARADREATEADRRALVTRRAQQRGQSPMNLLVQQLGGGLQDGEGLDLAIPALGGMASGEKGWRAGLDFVNAQAANELAKTKLANEQEAQAKLDALRQAELELKREELALRARDPGLTPAPGSPGELLTQATQATAAGTTPESTAVRALSPKIGVFASAPPAVAKQAMQQAGVTPEALQSVANAAPFNPYRTDPVIQPRNWWQSLLFGEADPIRSLQETGRLLGFGEEEGEYRQRMQRKTQAQQLIDLLRGSL